MRTALLIGLVGCGRLGFDSGTPAIDAQSDSPVTQVPCNEPWSAPFEVIGEFLSGPSITADGLEIFGGSTGDIVVATRASRDEAFSQLVALPGPVNSAMDEGYPAISDDGLELIFVYTFMSNAFTYTARRPSRTSAFETPVNNGAFGGADLSRDRLTLYTGDYQSPIRVHHRSDLDSLFTGTMDLAGPVNGAGFNSTPSISSDDLDLYFQSDRSGTWQVWVAHRPDGVSDFSSVELIDIPNFQADPEIAADGHRLYYRAMDNHVWAISRCE